jgi:hypothetical protein
MRKTPILIASCMIALAGIAMTPRTWAQSQTQTLTGKLVDLACYSLNKAETGNAHRGGSAIICAQGCAREGFPVGLLTDSGKVYEVRGGLAANLNAKLAPHMAHTVTITGQIGEADGMPAITADELKMVSK